MSVLRILLVEDEILIAEDARLHLERMGYVVVGAAASGSQAVQEAAELLPDLILMDVRLQEAMNGVEAARRIRSQADIPIITSPPTRPFLLRQKTATAVLAWRNRFLHPSCKPPFRRSWGGRNTPCTERARMALLCNCDNGVGLIPSTPNKC
jgi:ActR/RegA family two-component response regulator